MLFPADLRLLLLLRRRRRWPCCHGPPCCRRASLEACLTPAVCVVAAEFAFTLAICPLLKLGPRAFEEADSPHRERQSKLGRPRRHHGHDSPIHPIAGTVEAPNQTCTPDSKQEQCRAWGRSFDSAALRSGRHFWQGRGYKASQTAVLCRARNALAAGWGWQPRCPLICGRRRCDSGDPLSGREE
jgi:hypothetical protein